MNVEPLESTFITSLTAAPRGNFLELCTLRFAVFFKKENWIEFKSKSNPNPKSI